MKLITAAPIVISDKGQRNGNEDTAYPTEGDAPDYDQTVFLVCDGVGGEAKGEVASKLAAQTIGQALNDLDHYTEKDIHLAIKAAEDAIAHHIENNPASRGMATTLTLLTLDTRGAMIAHLGDSRIYQFREGKILRMTEDHSMVQELLTSGLITPEQARNHPRRNVVTKVIMAAPNPVSASIERINDLKTGDAFFLCSDGVLECFDDDALEKLMTPDANRSDQDRMDSITATCRDCARDNFTACLVRLTLVEGLTGASLDPAQAGEASIPEGQSYTPWWQRFMNALKTDF